MEATLDSTPALGTTNGKTKSRLGLAISALPVLFLAFDAIIKLSNLPAVAEANASLGLPAHLARGLGVLELALLVLYLVPRTALVGAILWTGYLGGAIAIHLRVSNPLFSHTLFPLYVALPLWVGLALRDGRVRGLVK
jgi:hypothetical protein